MPVTKILSERTIGQVSAKFTETIYPERTIYCFSIYLPNAANKVLAADYGTNRAAIVAEAKERFEHYCNAYNQSMFTVNSSGQLSSIEQHQAA